MKTKLNRLRLRDLALFVVVAGAVAVGGLFAAREAGIGDGAAVAEGERLVLTLTPEADYCVTERPEEAWGYGSGGVRQSSGWIVAAETAVQWNVSGGEPPYTLEIGGQSTDAAGRLWSGANGRVSVPCADTSVSWRWGTYTDEAIRYYNSEPVVDSGWHTIEAEVKDANGKKAKATAHVYVVLDLGTGTTGEILYRGKTYRVLGNLITAPESFDLEFGSIWEPQCRDNDPNPRCGHPSYSFGLVGAEAGIALYVEDGTFESRWNREVRGADGSRVRSIDQALDGLIASLGKPP